MALSSDVEVRGTTAIVGQSVYTARLAFGKAIWRHVGGPDLGPISMNRIGLTSDLARALLDEVSA